MIKKFPLLLVLCQAAIFWISGPSAARAPARIASLNLCADQILLALAAPEQIASLSPLSRDPDLSYAHEQAFRFPSNAGRGEALVLHKPDLALIGPFERGARRFLLERVQVPVLVLPPWTGIAMGKAQIREVADRIGREEQGEALVLDLDAALARTKGIAAHPVRVLVLHKRGYTPGETGLLDELLRHIGWQPYAESYGLAKGGTVPLERLIQDPPDLLLLGTGDAKTIDQASALLAHPALLRVFPPAKRVVVPDALTFCGGPSVIALLKVLEEAVIRHSGLRLAFPE